MVSCVNIVTARPNIIGGDFHGCSDAENDLSAHRVSCVYFVRVRVCVFGHTLYVYMQVGSHVYFLR